MNRYKEKRPDCTIIHFEGPMGDDRTLCGAAVEGACVKSDDFPMQKVESGKVNCADCIQIIDWCKFCSPRLIDRRRRFSALR